MHCNGCARKVEKHISKMEGSDLLRSGPGEEEGGGGGRHHSLRGPEERVKGQVCRAVADLNTGIKIREDFWAKIFSTVSKFPLHFVLYVGGGKESTVRAKEMVGDVSLAMEKTWFH
ncbi:hypothetical protein B296_00031923, partial [Ensete ventricosum]